MAAPALDIAASLRAACPELPVLTDAPALDAVGVDALRPSRGRPELAAARVRPLAVAEPRDVDDVARLVRWANDARVPLVPHGGGSGLMGGALVLRPAVAVDLRRLDRIAVDRDACLVRAGAGAALASIDAALARERLMLGHDPWTVGVATVGGAISTAGLGYLGAAAGPIGSQVRAIEAILADGRILRTRPSPARSTGLDLTRLFIGTEGTLGIVTEATLAVLPRPEERIVRAYRLGSFGAGVQAAAAFRRIGVRYACLELDGDGTPPESASLLLVFDGLRGEATIHAERAAAILADTGAEPLPAAEGERQWAERHAIAERWAARRRLGADDWQPEATSGQFDYAHVGIPLAAVERVRATVRALVERHGVTLVEEGIWHWPELYSIVVTAAADGAAGIRDVIDGVCRAAEDAGGTMEYCHGVGWKLAHLMEGEHGSAGLDVLRRVKARLDPHGILNPGKGGL